MKKKKIDLFHIAFKQLQKKTIENQYLLQHSEEYNTGFTLKENHLMTQIRYA